MGQKLKYRVRRGSDNAIIGYEQLVACQWQHILVDTDTEVSGVFDLESYNVFLSSQAPETELIREQYTSYSDVHKNEVYMWDTISARVTGDDITYIGKVVFHDGAFSLKVTSTEDVDVRSKITYHIGSIIRISQLTNIHVR